MDWMLTNGKRLARIIAGFLLIVIGIIGGFIPILQGWVFILAGLAVWSVDFVWARRLRGWLLQRFHSARDRWRERHRRD